MAGKIQLFSHAHGGKNIDSPAHLKFGRLKSCSNMRCDRMPSKLITSFLTSVVAVAVRAMIGTTG